MNILLFEDAHVSNLSPIATGRPAFAISCGSYRLVDLVSELSSSLHFHVRPHLAPLVSLDYSTSESAMATDSLCLCLNARLAPTQSNRLAIQGLLQESRPLVISDERCVLAALIPAQTVPQWRLSGYSPTDPCLADCGQPDCGQPDCGQPDCGQPDCGQPEIRLDVFSYLHDLIRLNIECIASNLDHRIASGVYREIADGVYSADPGALPGEHVVTRTATGPIVLEKGCSIGAFTVIEGPVYLGTDCRIMDHSSIKDAVSAGPTCKLGGEIEASIVEGFTNKQHHGFIGHSHLGQWINLGAGTCNSDLKNTYGKVNMQIAGQKVATGMQFVGCFIGDYVRTAINTSIFTGKRIGACSSVYGFATKDVAAFTNDARLFGKLTAVSPQVMIQTQARMFGRRNVPQRQCDIDLIHSMYQLTAEDRRGLECEPLVI